MKKLQDHLWLIAEKKNIPLVKDQNELINWAISNKFHLLGRGWYRSVYDLRDGTVLKIIRQSILPFLNMNKKEAEILKCLNGSFAPRLISAHPNGLWINVEKTIPVTEEEFEEYWSKIVPGPYDESGSFEILFNEYIGNLIDTGEDSKNWLKIPLIKKLVNTVRACGFDGADLHYENWGRTADGSLVIIDFGGVANYEEMSKD